jgi:hypothetical protein
MSQRVEDCGLMKEIKKVGKEDKKNKKNKQISQNLNCETDLN